MINSSPKWFYWYIFSPQYLRISLVVQIFTKFIISSFFVFFFFTYLFQPGKSMDTSVVLNLEKGQVAEAVPSTFLFLKRQNGLTGEDRALRRHPWVHPDCISPWAGYLHLRCLSFLTWKQWLCHQPACRGPVRAGCEYSCTEFRLSAQELKEPLRWP